MLTVHAAVTRAKRSHMSRFCWQVDTMTVTMTKVETSSALFNRGLGWRLSPSALIKSLDSDYLSVVLLIACTLTEGAHRVSKPNIICRPARQMTAWQQTGKEFQPVVNWCKARLSAGPFLTTRSGPLGTTTTSSAARTRKLCRKPRPLRETWPLQPPSSWQ